MVTADLSLRSISELISHEFFLKICMRVELTRVLIDQKVIAQMGLQWCKGRLDCLNIDPKQIKATAESDTDLSHM